MRTRQLLIFLLAVGTTQITAQEESNRAGNLSGSLQANGNFFIRDSLIGAYNTPQYDHQLYGAEAWLDLLYNNWGFEIGLRFDLFQNSNLLNPNGSYTAQGIGRWFVSKDINKLGISAGYIYDIVGSGIIFRAYEERPLAIDQALYGLRLTYDLAPDWRLKVFTGRQKQQFDTSKSSLYGLSLDGFMSTDSASVTLAPGFGIVGRTISDDDMNNFVATLNLYRPEDIFIPKYNTYAFTMYNTLTAGPVNWYFEVAYKSKDAFNDPFQERVTVSGDLVTGRYLQGTGSVLYSSLSYAGKGLGITIEGKWTENFDFRTRPQEEGNRGLLHYLPPMTRINTYRVLSRYNAATQYSGEWASQADISYALNRSLNLNLNFSNITNLDGLLLYRETYAEVHYKYQRKWTLNAGVQLQRYNQEVYEFKPGAIPVKTVTPFADFLYKFTPRRALRLETQYMNVAKENGERADYGNWLHVLAEYTVAPHWTLAASDMFNISPGKLSPVNSQNGKHEIIHFQRFDVSYNFRTNRFSLSYVKQPEGVVCSGGICRLEPAFNGIKVGVNSTF